MKGGMYAMATQTTAPDPETLEKPKRRHFTAAFKAKILDLTDPATPQERAKILRKHGLYSSHLTEWRRARDCATLAALTKKRGPKSKADPLQDELDRLARENAQLRRKLEVAELIIDVQKKPRNCSGSSSTRRTTCARTDRAGRGAGRQDRRPAGLRRPGRATQHALPPTPPGAAKDATEAAAAAASAHRGRAREGARPECVNDPETS